MKSTDKQTSQLLEKFTFNPLTFIYYIEMFINLVDLHTLSQPTVNLIYSGSIYCICILFPPDTVIKNYQSLDLLLGDTCLPVFG